LTKFSAIIEQHIVFVPLYQVIVVSNDHCSNCSYTTANKEGMKVPLERNQKLQNEQRKECIKKGWEPLQ